MPVPFDFQNFLTDLDDGKFHEQLCDLWPKVTQAVMETGKKGSLTIKIAASKNGKMAIVTSIATISVPAPATEQTMFYVDKQGHTIRHDPEQLPLRHVSLKPPTELRVVEPKTAVPGEKKE
jgi:hypothetical protein